MYSPGTYGGLSYPSVEVAEVMRRYLESVASQGPVVRSSRPRTQGSLAVLMLWRPSC